MRSYPPPFPFTCVPFFFHKCIGCSGVCIYRYTLYTSHRIASYHIVLAPLFQKRRNKKYIYEDLVLESQNHTPQNDETKLITRPFSICNDRAFAFWLNHLSHASARISCIYAHINAGQKTLYDRRFIAEKILVVILDCDPNKRDLL